MAKKAEQAVMAVAVQKEMCLEGLKACIRRDFSDQIYVSYGLFPAALPVGSKVVCEIDFTVKEDELRNENKTEFILQVLAEREDEFCEESINRISDEVSTSKHDIIAENSIPNEDFRHSLINDTDSSRMQRLDLHQRSFNKWKNWFLNKLVSLECIMKLAPGIIKGVASYHALESLFSQVNFGLFEEHSLRTVRLFIEERIKDPYALLFMKSIGVDLNIEEKAPLYIRHPNILPTLGLYRSVENTYRVTPKHSYTLENILHFSPAVLNDELRIQFVIYQILSALAYSHSQGIAHGDLNPSNILLANTYWCWLDGFGEYSVQDSGQNLGLSHACSSPQNSFCSQICPCHTLLSELKLSGMDWESSFRNWLEGNLSNFEYLLMLNKLAGRRWGDCAFHTVMPWVIDFSVKPDSASDLGWRDLTKSKWHLAKGDEQLDFTYATSEIPHHVSDECLSELAVCSYKARRLPLHLLRRAVRSVYEPNEYPANMQRLYQWTPDECIPEFYSDPHIFYSIHEGMSDLAVPPWASNPEEFIALHRQALESDRVSRNLHHWIDLTFGYKLSGEAAIAAKNVMLSNTTITSPRSSGRRQLFNKPHPMRKCFKGRFYNACNISNIDAVRTQYKSCSKVDFSSFISPLVDMEEIALFTESARHLSPCYKPMAPVVTEHAERQNVQGSQNRSRKATSQIESTASRESSDQFYFSEAFENGQEKTFQDFLLWESKLSNSSASEAFANDIFSVGCIIAELYLQRPLFDKMSLVFYSKYGVFPGIINRLKPSVRRVVELTLQRDWRRRPSAKELIESPYFSSMVRSAYQFLAPVYLYGKNSSRLEYAASVGRELLPLMGYKTAEMCLHSCLPLIMTSEHKEVECAVQLLRAFLEILGPQAARSLLLPSAQKIFQSSELSHLKVSLLQISFVQDLWKACGLDLYLEKIHPLIISNLTTSSQKNSVTAASVLLVGSCEDLGVPISVHQTILPIMQYFGRGINFEGIETLIRIGGILGEKMIIRQMFPLLRSIINSCLVSGKADRSEPCHSWHSLAIIDALTVLDGLVRILPTSVMLNELMQEQCNLLVRLLMQTDLSQSVLQHTANSLIAICQHIGPECTSSYILPQLTVLFDKLAISQEADVCLTDLTETAPSSRSGSPQYSQEIYLLYPSLASFLGIEMLRQCCSNWLHLERFLFHEYNWKWDNGMETSKNASDNKFTADVGKDAKHDFNPAKLLLNGVGWSIPQSNKSVVSTVRQTSDNKALANNGILSGNDYDPWFWLPPSSDSWEGLEYLGRFGGIKDDNAWKLKASVLHSVRAHPGTLRAVAVEDNESVVFSAGSGQRMRGMVCRWKLSTMKCDTTYLGHEEVVNDLCILRANERMASCDGTIHIWNSHTGKHIALFSEPSDISSSSLGTSIPSNARDINHGGNGLNVALSGGILSAGFHGSLYSCMQYLKAEDKLVAGTGSGYLRLIDINAGKQLHLWRCEPLETTFTSLISAICSSGLHERGTCKDSFSSSSWIATGFSSGHCRLLDLRSGAINASWHAHDSFITRLAALDSHLLISSSLDKTLRLWDLRSGAPHQLQLFRGLSDGVLSFSIWGHDMLSASGRKIGVTSLSRSHEQPQEQRIAPQNLYTADRGIKNMSVISSVCVLPFSRLFIVGTEDGYLKACC